MGLIEFMITCIMVVVIAWVGIWILGQVAPGYPLIIDKVIWIVAIIIILTMLLRATNIISHDPQIPRV